MIFVDTGAFIGRYVLMKRGRIRRAFSFDNHFTHAGFVIVPA
jgi:predicted nucleic acid-binding protein